MFSVGDRVFYPVNGAGIITQKHALQEFDDSTQCYTIEIIGRTKTTLRVPVKQAEVLGLRRVVEGSGLACVWDVLTATPEELPANYKLRYTLLEGKLQTGAVLQIAEVVRDLAWLLRVEEYLNMPGKRIYNRGLQLLVSELAAAQEIEIRAAELQVAEILRASFDALENALG